MSKNNYEQMKKFFERLKTLDLIKSDKFWCCAPLLNTRDLDGEMPEIFIACSNRTGGKTYNVTLAIIYGIINGYLDEIVVVCKSKNRAKNVAMGRFEAVLRDHYPEYTIKEENVESGDYIILHLVRCVDYGEGVVEEDTILGYTIPLNTADNLKDYSALFRNVNLMFTDEFQGNYCPDEVNKWANLHTTIARGEKDKATRYVPCILLSNSISIENPYFSELGITGKLQSNTKWLRGHGFVLQRFRNEFSAQQQRESRFNVALSGNKQIQSNIDNTWLNDDFSCIEKPDNWGRGYCHHVFQNGDETYGMYYYPDAGYFYISRTWDKTCKSVYNISPNVVEDIPTLRYAPPFVTLREKYYRGVVRFCDITAKSAVMNVLT